MNLITQSGYEKLKKTQEALKLEEKEAVKAVALAREFGDFSENAELDAGISWAERVRIKLAELDYKLRVLEIFDPASANTQIVAFGAQVEIEDENEHIVCYKFVGEDESDINEKKISIDSPIGKALIGRKEGDECTFHSPSGEKNFTIKKINYTWE